ncbi:uncharacterized protein KY384_006825 [Bacidia gigantensis]|uniref:uncharacterized protein n=1 Tax=Bacidia gigantensis TaxID=2732470 RepID=UPI001D03BE2D|nr:uncharacterized protein KY384_006825 [Bacidia gigantensis]KAG8527909.1 hypothetical protein KY384_006825 [Bacidia gigantensis]
MAAVAIWCMHYIGNRAILMLDASAGMRIVYSPGYTAGSLFLALGGVGTAFYFFSMAETVTPFTALGGGIFMGGAICGMHYLGQVGIENYDCSYTWPYVVGAAAIAGTASTIALSIFFYLKSVWTNSWMKRVGVALILATGVSGMHWCATVGTKYRLRHFAVNTMSPQGVINVVTVLASTRSCH